MREKETSPFLYFYFYSFWFLDHDTWASRIDTWHRKDLSQQNNFSKRRRRQAAHGSIDITSSLDICEDGLIPRRHKEGHIRQLSNWDAWGVSRLGQEKGWWRYLTNLLEDPRPWHLRAPKHPVESTCPPSTTSSSSRVCTHEQRHKTWGETTLL